MKHEYALIVVRKTGNGPVDRIFGIDVAFFDSRHTHYSTTTITAPLIERPTVVVDWKQAWVEERWSIGCYEEEWQDNLHVLDLAQREPTVSSERDLLVEFIQRIKEFRKTLDPDQIFVMVDADFGATKLQERINYYGINLYVGELIHMKHYFMGVACLSPEKSWDTYENFFANEVLPHCPPVNVKTDTHVGVYVKHFLYVVAYRKMRNKSLKNPVLYVPHRRFMLGLVFVGFMLALLLNYGSRFF